LGQAGFTPGYSPGKIGMLAILSNSFQTIIIIPQLHILNGQRNNHPPNILSPLKKFNISSAHFYLIILLP
jgi:hypothetical protein